MAYVDKPFQGGRNQPEQMTEEFLTCRLCLQPGFRSKPRLLNCGHTFCHPCLVAYTNDGRVRDICCPSCARPTPMPPRGCLDGLPVNLFADTQIDRLLRTNNNANKRENAIYNIPIYKVDRNTGHAHFDETS